MNLAQMANESTLKAVRGACVENCRSRREEAHYFRLSIYDLRGLRGS
jgi:hypothetical protein